jgi:hypothetical protein
VRRLIGEWLAQEVVGLESNTSIYLRVLVWGSLVDKGGNGGAIYNRARYRMHLDFIIYTYGINIHDFKGQFAVWNRILRSEYERMRLDQLNCLGRLVDVPFVTYTMQSWLQAWAPPTGGYRHSILWYGRACRHLFAFRHKYIDVLKNVLAKFSVTQYTYFTQLYFDVCISRPSSG